MKDLTALTSLLHSQSMNFSVHPRIWWPNGKDFYKKMKWEERCQRRWDKNMMADFYHKFLTWGTVKILWAFLAKKENTKSKKEFAFSAWPVEKENQNQDGVVFSQASEYFCRPLYQSRPITVFFIPTKGYLSRQHILFHFFFPWLKKVVVRCELWIRSFDSFWFTPCIFYFGLARLIYDLWKYDSDFFLLLDLNLPIAIFSQLIFYCTKVCFTQQNAVIFIMTCFLGL